MHNRKDNISDTAHKIFVHNIFGHFHCMKRRYLKFSYRYAKLTDSLHILTIET